MRFLNGEIANTRDFPMQTKRTVLAQVSLCRGCCCGSVERGRSEVPVEWMKDEWKRRGLKKSVHLTISGCLGPCDLHNVVSLSTPAGTVWLGGLRDFASYKALLEWAVAIEEAGRALPIPDELTDFRFDPFRLPEPMSPEAGEEQKAAARY